MFSSEFNLKGIVYTEVWSDEPDYILNGEQHSLKQVFINLFKNAVESIDRTGKVHLTVSLTDEKVSIRITDNGSGMPPENLKRIYEPFYTTKENGTGLGLLISQKIIQDHGGALNITSESDKGTSAEVVLPKK